MRQAVPIFFPFKSPAVRAASTSLSLTPSNWAAWAGPRSSGGGA